MLTFAERLDAAIEASGRTANDIANDADITPQHLSKLRNGEQKNPQLDLLLRLASALNTTVGALVGDLKTPTPEDERVLTNFRGWIDDQLVTIDALRKPNAEIARQIPSRAKRAADRKPIDNPFDPTVNLELDAVDDSMTGAGIFPGDKLYAIPAESAESAIGKIVACRIGETVFVKRLVTQHEQLFLLSENPRYLAIAVDPKSFELLGIVIGRLGRIA
ncbi:MAG TPA: S24 family peptidase [Thermoanaerobaculia bacterium]|nr:S24 family peptidase [Thermoanaerobaculia bacterium]